MNEIYESHGIGIMGSACKYMIDRFEAYGKNIIWEEGTLVWHPENISLGSNIYIGHETMLMGCHKNSMIVGDEARIGQRCFFHSCGGIKIGEGVGIGPGVTILTSFHDLNPPNVNVMNNKLQFGEVTIGDGSDMSES